MTPQPWFRCAFAATALLAGAGAASAQTLELISRQDIVDGGAQGDSDSFWPSISDDGRFVAFASFSGNLIPGGGPDLNPRTDIFVLDRHTGALELISRQAAADGGAQANGRSRFPAISGDGRFVAFVSEATNLIPGGGLDANGSVLDVFVFDRATGDLDLISRRDAADGGAQGNDQSFQPSISADGRFVAFQSRATNLIPGGGPDLNAGRVDVFVFDRATGGLELISRRDAAEGGAQGNDSSFSNNGPQISADGRFVAFQSGATNLVPGGSDANGFRTDILVFDRATGGLELVSRQDAADGGAQANRGSVWPTISDDGRFVAFTSRAINLVPGGLDLNGGFTDVFVFDRATGGLELISRQDAGDGGAQTNNHSLDPAISGDGLSVLFLSEATNLIPGGGVDVNGNNADVFVFDRPSGALELISRQDAGDGGAQADARSEFLAISGQGRFAAFASQATNLIPGGGPDVNGARFDVFVFDRFANQPPMADAGGDQVVECTSPAGAMVTLDGAGSSDPDGDPLSYAWSNAFGMASGVSPTVNLALGVHPITLVVNDGQLDSDPDMVMVNVVDTTPPGLVASLAAIGEGDERGDSDEGRFRVTFAAVDACDPAPAVTAVLVLPGAADRPVANGQIIEFEVEDEDTEVEFEDGIIEIEAPSLTLRVTASDGNGNTAVAEVQPAGLSGDNDDDSVASAEVDD